MGNSFVRHEVIMPQLGMAQDFGVVLSWMKSVGDKVEADDVLMEVETDKATMEVEAGASGIVATLRAEAGTEVAVGETVAFIETEASSNATDGRETAEPLEKAGDSTSSKAGREDATATKPARRSQGTAPLPSEKDKSNAPRRILASPKARYLAKTKGIDLRRLVRSGVSEPIHFAEVQSAVDRVPVSTQAMLSTEVSRLEFNALLELAEKDGVEIERSIVIAAFAAASYRYAKEITGAVLVELVSVAPDGMNRQFEIPDSAGLANAASSRADADNMPDVVVCDLIGTRFDDFRPGGESDVPMLTVSRSPVGDALKLRLRFAERDTPVPVAAALLQNLAMRLENPICHIL